MQPFTVIGFHEETDQIVCEHVMADNGTHALWVAAQAMPTLMMVAALPGHLTEGAGDVSFPAETLVAAGTVLEQPEAFGPSERGEDIEAAVETGSLFMQF